MCLYYLFLKCATRDDSRLRNTEMVVQKQSILKEKFVVRGFKKPIIKQQHRGQGPRATESSLAPDVVPYEPINTPPHIASYKSIKNPSYVASYEPFNTPPHIASYKQIKNPSYVAPYEPINTPPHVATHKPIKQPSSAAPRQPLNTPPNVATHKPIKQPSSAAPRQPIIPQIVIERYV